MNGKVLLNLVIYWTMYILLKKRTNVKKTSSFAHVKKIFVKMYKDLTLGYKGRFIGLPTPLTYPMSRKMDLLPLFFIKLIVADPPPPL